METLTINIPDQKSALVRQILKEFGVTIKSESSDNLKPSDYAKLINISKEDAQTMLKDIELSRNEWERDIWSYAELSSIIDTDFNISFINKIEVLGHRTADLPLRNFISQASIINVNDDIIEQTIEIRKTYKIKIPDAIVAATAIVNELILIARDVEDFKIIKGLNVENP